MRDDHTTGSNAGVEEKQRRALRRHRMIAGGLLLVALGIFAGTLWLPKHVALDTFWVELVRAGAEAALVGGLADWFAVTALFRHPLGIPIPHTALIPKNKDRLGAGMARFIEQNFLAPDLVAEKLRGTDLAGAAARWLSKPGNAAAMGRQAAAAVPYVVDSLRDKDVRDFIREALSDQLAKLRIAPAFGKGLEILTERGQHDVLLSPLLDVARRALEDNETRIREIVASRSRWWTPRTFDRRIAGAVIDGIGGLIDELADPESKARARFEEALAELIARLKHDPETAARLDALRDAALGNPAAQAYLGSVWDEIRTVLLDDVRRDDSAIRQTVAAGCRSLGRALENDPDMRRRLNARIIDIVKDFVVPWRHEIGVFIQEVVKRWDGRTLADKVELAAGKDLQFIRINGTLVGALVGIVIFLVTGFVI